jgi:hypothetical protein
LTPRAGVIVRVHDARRNVGTVFKTETRLSGRHQPHPQEVEARIGHAVLQCEVLLNTGTKCWRCCPYSNGKPSCRWFLKHDNVRTKPRGGVRARSFSCLPCQPWAASIPSQLREGRRIASASCKTANHIKGHQRPPKFHPTATWSSGARPQWWTGITDASKSRAQISTFYIRPQKVCKVPTALIGDRAGGDAPTKVMNIFWHFQQRKNLSYFCLHKKSEKDPTYSGIDSYRNEEHKTPSLAVFRYEKATSRFSIHQLQQRFRF